MIAIVDYGAGNIRSVMNALKRSLDSARDDTGAVISTKTCRGDRVISAEAGRPSGEPFGMRSPTGRAQIPGIILTADRELLRAADKVILPGVGEASTAMKALQDCGLAEFIPTLEQPVLGICVGAQLMCAGSEEGDVRCMGIFPAEVRRFRETAAEKVPHMGWNSLCPPDAKGICARPVGLRIPKGSPFGPGASVEMTAPALSSRATASALSSRATASALSSRAKSRDLSSPLFAGLPECPYVYFVHSYYPEICTDTIAVSHHGIDFSAALARDNFFACQFHPEKSGTVGEIILKNFLNL